MQLSFSTHKKIGVVYGFLVILVVIALGVRFWQGNNLKKSTSQNASKSLQTPKAISYTGKFSLVSNAQSYKVGDEIDVTIIFEAPGKILDGADVILRFDPDGINALGFAPGAYFNLVPRKDMDNETGTVKITALDAASNSLMSDKVILGTVNFQAIKPGTSQVNFDFAKGATSKTTLIEKDSSQNILGEAKGVTIRVEP